MDFNEISQKYNLDFNGLAKILKKHNITLNLEHLNAIPDSWIPIIEEDLGLISASNNLKETIKRRSPASGSGVKDVVKSGDNEENTKHSKSGKDTRRNTIKDSNKKSKKTSLKKHYAYVLFVGPKKDHAFLRIIDNINDININSLVTRGEKSYRLKENCSEIIKGQIVLITIKNEKYKLASIEETTFIGTFIKPYIHDFVNWTSYDVPATIENVEPPVNLSEDELFIAVRLMINYRGDISCDNANKPILIEDIGPLIKNHFTEAISSKKLSNKILIMALKKVIDENSFHNEVKEFFLSEVSDKTYLETEGVFQNFIERWSLIDSSVIRYGNFNNPDSKIIYFDLWLKEKLPLEFWESYLIDVFLEYNLCDEAIFEEHNLNKVSINFYNEIQVKLLNDYVLQYCKPERIIDSIEVYETLLALINFANSNNRNDLVLIITNALTPYLKFQLWINGENDYFDKSFALELFPESNQELQSRILIELSNEDILKLLPYIKGVYDKGVDKKIFRALQLSIKRHLDFICFDLETNGEFIKEIGWVDENNNENFFSNANEVDSGLKQINSCALNKATFFIGHNIVEWDVPILSKFDISIQENQVWDTLLVEAFLSPEFKNYALITAHNAIDDSKLTRNLFYNQLFRILYMQENELAHLFSYLPDLIVKKIKDLKIKVTYNWSPLILLNTEKTIFFRPQPKPNFLIEKIKKKIEVLESENILIIGSDSFKHETLVLSDIKFHCNDSSNKDLYELNKTKINEIDDSYLWEKHVLLNYVDYFASKGLPMFWKALPVSVKIRIENSVSDLLSLFYPNKEIQWSTKNVVFLTIPELLLYQVQLSQLNDINVITVQRDLLSIENKQILKEVSLDFLMSELENDNIWLNFSGGQSFTELTIKQCEKLAVDVPELFDNIWVEKRTLNKFNIWGNYNWENLLDSFNIKSVYDIQPDATALRKEQTIIAQVSAVESLKNKVVRFNPESLYRSRYWVFQKQLIDQIITQDVASVLIIQDYNEIEVLQNYLTHQGYYIPKQSISIGRRLELLHQSKSNLKLIIEHFSQLEKIIQSNHIASLNVIFDSFSLLENYYSARNSSYFKNLNTSRIKKIRDYDNEDSNKSSNNDGELDISNKPIISDAFFLIELLKPRIFHIRNLLHDADSNHKLWVLDPRFNDYTSLHKTWNISKATLKIWENFETYEAAVNVADMHIDSVKPIEDLPFDNGKIKEIIRQVFLKEFAWRDSQIPYLDLIIEGKEDQLVTLPTGEGKSVLFQGPALFKGAFTNRLTIVVTPLKALMEDQVQSLWDKGFFGSVDYINSDRSSDVYSIYRALAGGELSLLFVTPERFRSQSFNNALEMRIQSDGGLQYGVFDEAHCVSQWGHEFRPDYFNCAKRMLSLKKLSRNNFPLLLFSATVSKKIYNDFNDIFS